MIGAICLVVGIAIGYSTRTWIGNEIAALHGKLDAVLEQLKAKLP